MAGGVCRWNERRGMFTNFRKFLIQEKSDLMRTITMEYSIKSYSDNGINQVRNAKGSILIFRGYLENV